MKHLRYLTLVLLFLSGVALTQEYQFHKMSDRLLAQYEAGDANTWFTVGILLSDQVDVLSLDADLSARMATAEERSVTVITALKNMAEQSQAPLLDWLKTQPGTDMTSVKRFWISNIVFIKVKKDVLGALTLHPATGWMDIDAIMKLDEYVKTGSGSNKITATGGHEPGHDAINAVNFWKLGYTGYGRLAMGIDTGVDPTHPGLSYKWRGTFRPAWEAWYDPIDATVTPYDCDQHGTHTMGTMVGLTPATNDTFGVAFNGQWIAAPGICTSPATSYCIAAFQWSVDPDSNPTTVYDRPDAICNSWYDPNVTNECTSLYVSTFNSVEATGVAIVFSAGNNGPGASTITKPKNINTTITNVFCVANVNGFTTTSPIASSSSRGPGVCTGTGSLLIKPEVAAPGTNVRSSIPGAGYDNFTGTSMACPHVVGAILLLKEAFPNATGTQIKEALYYTATDMGTAGEDNDFGMGMINLMAAYNYLLTGGHVPGNYAYDAEVNQVLIPSPCGSSISPEFYLKNTGTATLTSVDISWEYSTGATGSSSWSGTLAPGASTLIALPGASLTPGSYWVDIRVSNPSGQPDSRPFNNQYYKEFNVYAGLSITEASRCGAGTVTLGAVPASGWVDWYTTLSGGSPVGTGASFTTPILSTTTVYYAEQNDSGRVGAPNNVVAPGGYVTFNNRYLQFTANQDCKLEEVTVYLNGTGSRTIELRNSGGTVLNTYTFSLGSGTHKIPVNFNLTAGDYQLGLSTGSATNIFRSNSGVTYPYSFGGVIDITGSDAGSGFYYYFYNWKVSYTSMCGRQPVTATINPLILASFTPSATTVDLSVSGLVNFTDGSSSGTTSWAWDFGDGGTSSSASPSHTYTAVGTYIVQLIATGPGGCTDTAYDTINVIMSTGINDPVFGNWSVYPNPADKSVTVFIPATLTEAVSVSLTDLQGREIRNWSIVPHVGEHEISIDDIPAGMYHLVLKRGTNISSTKLVVQ